MQCWCRRTRCHRRCCSCSNSAKPHPHFRSSAGTIARPRGVETAFRSPLRSTRRKSGNGKQFRRSCSIRKVLRQAFFSLLNKPKRKTIGGNNEDNAKRSFSYSTGSIRGGHPIRMRSARKSKRSLPSLRKRRKYAAAGNRADPRSTAGGIGSEEFCGSERPRPGGCLSIAMVRQGSAGEKPPLRMHLQFFICPISGILIGKDRIKSTPGTR